MDLKGYRRERGLLWPEYDRRCAEVTFDETAENMRLITSLVPNGRVAIQAGGNCGQLVREMAGAFEAVYTFEPDAKNFVALTINTADSENVFRFQAALGNDEMRGTQRGMAGGDAKHPDDNCGALYMTGQGAIPTITIDDLGLSNVDLVMLDIEGGELGALAGAGKTIAASKPVIIFENKGLGHRFYGEAKHGSEDYLRTVHGYVVKERRKIDTIMVSS